MPIQIIPGPEAVDTVKSNVVSTWPPRSADATRVEPIAKPEFFPTFELERGEKIFTIGSCFARNVEAALIARGFEIPAREALKADPDFASFGPSILNNFGVPSIFNEISWALGAQPFIAEQNFYEIGAGKFVDIHLNQTMRPAPFEIVEKRRAAIRSAYSAIADCRIVIITLGLNECWFDNVTGLYLNTSPRRSMIRDEPDRFALHVLDFEQTIGFLRRTFDILRDRGRRDLRVVLTVSPVPLTATYRRMDVMVANMYSKSALRTAAEHIIHEYDFVDYYPSFESILISERSRVWNDDLVHIQKPMIDFNVNRMVARYVGDTDAVSDDPKALLESLAEPRVTPGFIFGALEQRQSLFADNADLALLFAEAAVRLRKGDEARAALEAVPENFASAKKAWVAAQERTLANDHSAVIKLLEPHNGVFKRRYHYWNMLLTAVFGLKEIDEGQRLVGEWSKIMPLSAEPWRIGGVLMAKAGGPQADIDYMFRKAVGMNAHEDAGRAELDYAEFLVGLGRIPPARKLIESFSPASPSEARRFEELKLKLNVD